MIYNALPDLALEICLHYHLTFQSPAINFSVPFLSGNQASSYGDLWDQNHCGVSWYSITEKKICKMPYS